MHQKQAESSCNRQESSAVAISSKDERQDCTGPNGPTPWQSCPFDLLLEFAARADATTLVRMAATSKSLRRGILSTDFRRRLLAARAAAGRWSDPALLCGISYATVDSKDFISETDVIGTPQSSPPRITIDRDDLFDLMPLASRDGFLVMISREDAAAMACTDLYVCDTLTGHVTKLPPISLHATGNNWHVPGFLSVDSTGRSFELLVATRGMGMKFQTFSSEAGQWGAVRAVTGLTLVSGLVLKHPAHPAVIGRRLHWMLGDVQCILRVVTLDIDTCEAAAPKFPWLEVVRSTSSNDEPQEPYLAAVGGQLSVICIRSLEINVWMSTSPETWTRQLVIRTPEIEAWAGLDVDSIRAVLPVFGFGERSGTLVLQLNNGDVVGIELQAKKATTLCKGMGRIKEVFLHEIDFPSLLKAMKSY